MNTHHILVLHISGEIFSETISEHLGIRHSTVRKIILIIRTFKAAVNLPKRFHLSDFASRSDHVKLEKNDQNSRKIVIKETWIG